MSNLNLFFHTMKFSLDGNQYSIDIYLDDQERVLAINHGNSIVRNMPIRTLLKTCIMIDHPTPSKLQVVRELKEYFGSKRTKFEMSYKIVGGSDFQQMVWKKIAAIKIGSALSYGQIADKIGNPRAVRAVGSAVGSNPISIVIPCHRVLGQSVLSREKKELMIKKLEHITSKHNTRDAHSLVGNYHGSSKLKLALLRHEINML